MWFIQWIQSLHHESRIDLLPRWNFVVRIVVRLFAASETLYCVAWFITDIHVLNERVDWGPSKCFVMQMGVGGGVSDFLEKSVPKV